MNADRAEAESEAFEATGHLLIALVRHHPQLVIEQLPAVLPWVRFLPAEDVQEFASEFVAVAESSASIGNLGPLAQLLTEWRHTAEVHADPELHRALTRNDLGDHGLVPLPDAS
ncbi:MAG: hypothetical protein QG622_3177 [Actinomycetota bacterium]|nr:hypothetical protein [Actinomycetota bacterium]